MKPITDIGEILLCDAENDYFFRPSFVAMASIGSPADIVTTYSILNGYEVTKTAADAIEVYGKVPDWLIYAICHQNYDEKILTAAITVMTACCENDISQLVGEWQDLYGKLTYFPGSMNQHDIVTIAKELALHGIIGKAPVRVLQRHQGKSEYTNEFRAIDYINSARSHFDMPRSEAEQLTMTEFQLLLKNKYPDEKGFTKEEYDKISDDYFAQKEKRIAAEKKRLANANKRRK